MSAIKKILTARNNVAKARQRYMEVLRTHLIPGRRVLLTRYGPGAAVEVLEVIGHQVRVRAASNREYLVDAVFIEAVYESDQSPLSS